MHPFSTPIFHCEVRCTDSGQEASWVLRVPPPRETSPGPPRSGAPSPRSAARPRPSPAAGPQERRGAGKQRKTFECSELLGFRWGHPRIRVPASRSGCSSAQRRLSSASSFWFCSASAWTRSSSCFTAKASFRCTFEAVQLGKWVPDSTL